MKIVFFGTPDYVLPILTSVHKKFVTGPGKSPIVAIVTQSPKPTGRKQFLTYSPIDRWAHERQIDTRYDFNNDLPEADLGIVAAFGSLIPQKVINHFPHGILVVHPSLLPKFRWGSPIPAAIVTGSNPTGVTIMKMDEKFDHGPIVTQAKEDILPTDTSETLKIRLFEKSADMIIEMLEPYLKGKIKLKEQDHTKATFAREIRKEDAFIKPKYIKAALKGEPLDERWTVPFITDCSQDVSPETIERFIRAMYPWPTAWTLVKLSSKEQPKRMKIISSHLDGEKLVPDEVQIEGKNTVTFKQFTEAYPDFELS